MAGENPMLLSKALDVQKEINRLAKLNERVPSGDDDFDPLLVY
jgi:hypothetical protein